MRKKGRIASVSTLTVRRLKSPRHSTLPICAWSGRFLTAPYCWIRCKHSAATAAEHRFAGAGVIWLYTFRHFSSRSTESVPSTAVNNELRILRAINEEIVSLLPLGLLVHDQESNRTVISNKIANHLLPHLNLQNITTMAEQHQGLFRRRSITSCMRSACSAARLRRAHKFSLFAIRIAKCW
ncbi:two-component system sensor kinase [Escherichia coli]|uniref:Two-component system sensor kinase n=1 Tax=Escherichia coli TaxID=562 RepID=A0A376W7W1_ECOLX|nr:two-component system sensor kinase [Escherichia coli]